MDQLNAYRIAIDAPSDPKTLGETRRAAEAGLSAKGISYFPTPDQREWKSIQAKAIDHLRAGGEESRLPHANILWMLAGFELFRRLRQDWECLEVYPQAIAVVLGAADIPKKRTDGLLAQLAAAAVHTGWPGCPSVAALSDIGHGSSDDKLDSYLAAWVASLDEDRREAIGVPPDDAIWVPRLHEA